MTTATEGKAEDHVETGDIEALPVFDVADHLDSPEVIAAYLNDFFEEGDVPMITEALRDVSRARGMADVASEAGIAREALYKALRPGSQPRFETIVGVCRALGFRLVVQPISNVGSEESQAGLKV